MWTLMLRERIGIKCFGLERNKTEEICNKEAGVALGATPQWRFVIALTALAGQAA